MRLRAVISVAVAALLCCSPAFALSSRQSDSDVSAKDVAGCFKAYGDISLKAMMDDYDACKEEASTNIALHKLAKQIQREKKKKISEEKALQMAGSAKYSDRYNELRENVKEADRTSYALKQLQDPLRPTEGYRPLATSWFYLMLILLLMSLVARLVALPFQRRKGRKSSAAEAGRSVVFWVFAIAATPFLLRFYTDINPVLPYAKCINSVNFWGYYPMPAIQCGIFLIASWIVSTIAIRRKKVEGFVPGLVTALVCTALVLAALLILNILGLSVITTILGNVVVAVLTFVFKTIFILFSLIF